MSISPFGTRPISPEDESRRAKLALVAAAIGIAATLLAYAVSPGVRHAVGHAEHSVKHAVSRVFDRDQDKHARIKSPARPTIATGAHQPTRARPPVSHESAKHGSG
jgi:hypothetical protein